MNQDQPQTINSEEASEKRLAQGFFLAVSIFIIYLGLLALLQKIFDLSKLSQPSSLLISSVSLIAAPLLGCLMAGRQGLSQLIFAKGTLGHNLKWFLVIFLLSVIGACILEPLTIMLLNACGYTELPEQIIVSYASKESSLFTWSIMIFFTVFCAPLSEELIFRGFGQFAFRNLPYPWREIPVTLIFAVLHGLPQGIPSLFFLGIMFAVARRKGGLRLGMFVHGAFNLTMMAILLFKTLCSPYG